uniref:Ig-like domain-containing protein n=1 Tax=Amphilophus citrinellus TaxID=61819 RepID=A0A3Q0QT50_AMPCI
MRTPLSASYWVEARPGLVIKENESLTLDCSAKSYPSVNSIIWMKATDGPNKSTIGTQMNFTVKSASVSDSGWYSCTATNKIGTGNSEQVEVKVKLAASKPPYTYDFDTDTDTSEDDVEINYTQVNFKPKSGHQKARNDSSSSSSSSTEDRTQYSEVKI